MQPDSATQASITFQCFFRYYPRLAGMTVRLGCCLLVISCYVLRVQHIGYVVDPVCTCMQGTAKTEEQELFNIYRQTVVTIPPHRPKRRIDRPPRLYVDRNVKTATVLREVRTQ